MVNPIYWFHVINHIIRIKLLVIYTLYSFFSYVFEIQCVCYTYNPLQFRQAVFQVLHSHVWPVATILNGAILDNKDVIYNKYIYKSCNFSIKYYDT